MDDQILDDDTIPMSNTDDLEQRIYALEIRNRDLESRKSQLTKLCTVLTMFEPPPDMKIKRVNDSARIINHSFKEKISAVTKLSHRNEENQHILAIVEQWSRSLVLDDFINGSLYQDHGWRNGPMFSLEDFMTIFCKWNGRC